MIAALLPQNLIDLTNTFQCLEQRREYLRIIDLINAYNIVDSLKPQLLNLQLEVSEACARAPKFECHRDQVCWAPVQAVSLLELVYQDWKIGGEAYALLVIKGDSKRRQHSPCPEFNHRNFLSCKSKT